MKKYLITAILSCLLPFTNAAAQQTDKDINLYGSVIFASGWAFMPDAPYGIYSFSAKDGTQFTPIKTGAELKANGSGVYVGGKYFMTSYTTGEYGEVGDISYRVFDTENGWKKLCDIPQEEISCIATDLAYNPVDGNVYGCFYQSSDSFTFGTLNLSTGKSADIASLPEQLVALAINSKGDCYGIGASGKLYKMTIGTASVSLKEIGQTGLSVRYAQSATFDFATDRLFWSATMYDTSLGSSLYEVNTTDGSVKLVSNYPTNYEVTGLYTTSSYAAAGAPAAVGSPAFSYDKSSLSGSITFTMPTATAGGDNLTGDVSYSVNLDDDASAGFNGSATPGQQVSIQHTFAEPGLHLIRVRASNAAGNGDVRVVMKWIGKDTAKPLNPLLTATDTGLSLTWEAPTEGVNGGYIDTDDLSFRVVRQPEGKTVYSGKNTGFSEKLEVKDMGYYWYDVVAVVNGQDDGTASSNKITLGEACPLPYSQDFTSENALDWFTIIDANNDESTWSLGEGYVACTYDDNNAADDWLITPPLAMDKEHAYQLSVKVFGGSSAQSENIRIATGTKPEAASMDNEAGSVKEINWAESQEFSFNIVPEYDKPVYIGFQALGKSATSEIYINSISVSSVASVHAPDSVTALTATADAFGGRKATLSFKLPEKTIDGKEAASVSKVEIYRGSTKIGTIDSGLSDGKACVYDDDNAPTGKNTYKVIAYNASGNGFAATASTFVGEDIPGKVENLKLEDIGSGDVKLSWNAPSKGENGGYVNAGALSYDIQYNGYGEITSTKNTSITANVGIDEGKQKAFMYNVTAVSPKGTGETASSNVLFLGEAYALPFNESFARMQYQRGPWGIESDGLSNWKTSSGATATPEDGDYGMAMFSPTEKGASSRLLSPKLKLSDAYNPTLTFWLWHSLSANNTLQVILRDGAGNEHTLAEIQQNDQPEYDGSWKEYEYSLEEYKSLGDAQIIFKAVNNSYDITSINYLCVDNITVRSIYDNDLEAVSIEGGSETKVGEPISFDVQVHNNGTNTADDYSVELYRNDKLVSKQKGVTVRKGETVTITVSDTPNADAPQTSTYQAAINFPADDVPDNNKTDKMPVNILPGMPFIETLQGITSGDNTTTLTWKAPWTNPEGDESSEVTEDFESYSAFAISNIGQWKLIDMDGRTTGGIIGKGGNYIEYPNVEKPMAFMVFNPNEAGLSSSLWGAHSGNQTMACFLTTSGQNDDWLISPELDGKEQTIKFWTKAPDCSYYETQETIQVLYSTTGTETADFIQTGQDIKVGSEQWKQLSVTLPEGAKYFAIRCISKDQYILYIDDVTYRPAQNTLTLLGYNVYRDEQKLTSSPITETTYVDKAPAGEYSYTVTAVYNEGESIHSNKYSNAATGIGTNTSDGISVKGGYGHIDVSCPDSSQVKIVSVSGRQVYSGHGTARISLPKGVYIVKAGDKTAKTIVK